MSNPEDILPSVAVIQLAYQLRAFFDCLELMDGDIRPGGDTDASLTYVDVSSQEENISTGFYQLAPLLPDSDLFLAHGRGKSRKRPFG